MFRALEGDPVNMPMSWDPLVMPAPPERVAPAATEAVMSREGPPVRCSAVAVARIPDTLDAPAATEAVMALAAVAVRVTAPTCAIHTPEYAVPDPDADACCVQVRPWESVTVMVTAPVPVASVAVIATSSDPAGGLNEAVVSACAVVVDTTAGEDASSVSVPELMISASAMSMNPAVPPVGADPPRVMGVPEVTVDVDRKVLDRKST